MNPAQDHDIDCSELEINQHKLACTYTVPVEKLTAQTPTKGVLAEKTMHRVFVNSKVNSNHEITTQQQESNIFSPPPDFEPCSLRAKVQCATSALIQIYSPVL